MENKKLLKKIKNKWVALRIADINPAEDCSNAFLHNAIRECVDWEEQTEQQLIESVIEYIEDRNYSYILQENWEKEVKNTIENGSDFLELRLARGYVYASVDKTKDLHDLFNLFKSAELERGTGLDELEKVYITIDDNFEIFDVNFDSGDIVKSDNWIDITEFILLS